MNKKIIYFIILLKVVFFITSFNFSYADNFNDSLKNVRAEINSDNLQEAIKILKMSAPVTVQEIKSQYKKLAKKNHPDSNGGDKRSEEKLKSINQAYSVLMACRDIP